MRLSRRPFGVILHGIFSALGGLYLATWLGCKLGTAVVMVGALISCDGWLVSRRPPG